MSPVCDPPDMPVFDRIEMQLLEVRTIVLLVTNQVFPIAPLPYPPLSTRPGNRGAPLGGRQDL
ncbi:hypothetical protein AZOA_18530 [Azoarcus sp. Aa7]|nr:hypothetical protein [Azoarcus sp. Aa7]